MLGDVRYLETRLQIAPESSRLHRLLAALLAEIPGRNKEAAKHLRQAIQLNPSDVNSLCDLAVCLNKEGKREGAMAALNLALRRNPVHHPSLVTLSAFHFSRGEYTDCEGLCRRAVAARPHDPQARRNLARILAQLGRADQAAEENERALQFGRGSASPYSAAACGKLAAQSLQIGRNQRAAECAAIKRDMQGKRVELPNSEKTAELLRIVRLSPT